MIFFIFKFFRLSSIFLLFFLKPLLVYAQVENLWDGNSFLNYGRTSDSFISSQDTFLQIEADRDTGRWVGAYLLGFAPNTEYSLEVSNLSREGQWYINEYNLPLDSNNVYLVTTDSNGRILIENRNGQSNFDFFRANLRVFQNSSIWDGNSLLRYGIEDDSVVSAINSRLSITVSADTVRWVGAYLLGLSPNTSYNLQVSNSNYSNAWRFNNNDILVEGDGVYNVTSDSAGRLLIHNRQQKSVGDFFTANIQIVQDSNSPSNELSVSGYGMPTDSSLLVSDNNLRIESESDTGRWIGAYLLGFSSNTAYNLEVSNISIQGDWRINNFSTELNTGGLYTTVTDDRGRILIEKRGGGSYEDFFQADITTTRSDDEPIPPENHVKNSVRQYTFNHSLWYHNSERNAVTGYWVGEFALASGSTYAWNGQFGQLDYHYIPPTPQLGSGNSGDVFPYESAGFNTLDLDNILIMPPNYVQLNSEEVNQAQLDNAGRVIDYVLSQSGGNHVGTPIYIYEHWPEAQYDSLNASQWSEYHNWTKGSYHRWFINYQNRLSSRYSAVDFRMIPLGPIISDVLQNSSLNVSNLSFSDMYEDNAPHGTTNLYFLAGLITYQAMYGQKVDENYTPPIDAYRGVDRTISDEFNDINNFVWERLNYYNNNGVRIWPD